MVSSFSKNEIYFCATSGFFETFIFVCIFVNALIMTIRFFPTLIPQYWQVGFATEIANFIFALIFTLEALFKIIGLGQQYFCKKNCRKVMCVLVCAAKGLRLLTL